MADYRQFCNKCGAVLGFGSTHLDSCSFSPRYDLWIKEQKFKDIAREANYDVKENWLVCIYCFCLTEKSLISVRTHRRACGNPYIAGTTSQDIKDKING